MKSTTTWVSAAVMTLLLSVVPLDSTAEAAENIYLTGPETRQDLADTVVGPGIEGFDTAPLTPTALGTIRWVRIREHDDLRGGRHVFYRQEYAPLAGAAGQGPVRDGVPLSGAELGLHFGADGQLRAAFGTQY